MKSTHLAAAVALAAASLTAQAQTPQFTVIDLGIAPGSTSSMGTALSSYGNYAIGRSVNGTTSATMFTWSATGGRVDWTMPAGEFGLANAWQAGGVNNLGVAVATLGSTATGSQGTLLPFMASASGAVTALTMPAGATTGRVADVNDSGIAVGQATIGGVTKAVLFNTATNTSTTIDTTLADGTFMTQALAINNAGLVIGRGQWKDQNNITQTTSVLYDTVSGTLTKTFNLDASFYSGSGVTLMALSESGLVAGYTGTTPFILSTATGASQKVNAPNPTGTPSTVSINDSGVTVGRIGGVPSGFTYYSPNASSASVAWNTLIGSSGYTVVNNASNPFSIGNDGSVLATATIGGVQHAVLMSVSAVPEPSSWALMLAGIAGVGAIARRRKAVA